MVVLLGSLSVSACSNLSDISETVSGAASAVNPFKQQTEGSEPAPTNESMPLNAPATSIRVETKPPEPRGQQEVEINVGNNKQCTTFCALPMHKPPLN
jgi:hypothetical protein